MINEQAHKPQTIKPHIEPLPELMVSESASDYTKVQPVYKQSADYALENDELQAWRDSRNLNVECGKAIDRAVIASNYEPNLYDLKTAAKTVIDEYGADRVAWVISGNVNYHDLDGRLSESNKAWAKEIGAVEKPDFYLKTHLAILDGFMKRFREVEKEKPSLLVTLDKNESKSREQKKAHNIGIENKIEKPIKPKQEEI